MPADLKFDVDKILPEPAHFFIHKQAGVVHLILESWLVLKDHQVESDLRHNPVNNLDQAIRVDRRLPEYDILKIAIIEILGTIEQ